MSNFCRANRHRTQMVFSRVQPALPAILFDHMCSNGHFRLCRPNASFFNLPNTSFLQMRYYNIVASVLPVILAMDPRNAKIVHRCDGELFEQSHYNAHDALRNLKIETSVPTFDAPYGSTLQLGFDAHDQRFDLEFAL